MRNTWLEHKYHEAVIKRSKNHNKEGKEMVLMGLIEWSCGNIESEIPVGHRLVGNWI